MREDQMIQFDAHTGLLHFEGTPFCNGRILFQFDDLSLSSADMTWRQGSGFVAAASGMECRVRTGGGKLTVRITNRGRAARMLRTVQFRFDPKALPAAPQAADYREFIHSFNFQSESGVKKVGLPGRWLAPNVESCMLYVLREVETGQSMLFGTLPPHAGDLMKFRALHDAPHMEGHFGLCITSVQDRLIPPKGLAQTSPIQVRTGPDPLALLDDYGRRLGRAWKRELKPVQAGWNSWDYYAGAVTSDDVLKNVCFARKRLARRLETFVIDEGYEFRWGEWIANRQFPEGLREFCRRVKREGGTPGVWTAPLLVNKYTVLYSEHPDWFMRNRDGAIAGRLFAYGPMAYLDITVPDAERWLYDTFARLRRDGFEYFKVDFAQHVLEADVWHDRTVPRGALLRRAFETIRRAIGESSYLLACGAPYEPVIGIPDAVRVGRDIHNFWEHVLINVPAIAARWWTHRRVWNVDPDFLIVRSPETCTLPRLNREYAPKPFNSGGSHWLAGRELNLREVKAYALLVYLSAGEVMLSDELPTLNQAGLDILRKVLERPLPEAAVPVDMFNRHDALPSIWHAREEGGHFLGLFNWTEDRATISVDLRDLGIRNWSRIERFWDGMPFEAPDGRITVDLPPRSGEGLRICA
jgi:hypothetical protein